MMNAFVPAIVAIVILAAAFVLAWVSDVRGTESSDVTEEASAGEPSLN